MDSQKASAPAMTLPMCKWLSTERADDYLVAWSESREWRQCDFRQDVLSLLTHISATSHTRWALCFEDNYSFAVALLAVLYSGNTPVLPGHFRPAVLAEQRDEFDALITDLDLTIDCPVLRLPCSVDQPLTVLPNWPENPALHLFTSGSTGKPQKIIKPITCLELESQWLSARWGDQFADAHFVATVAPHHMYGLSFAFMLPLSLGRPFATKSVEYHEQLQSLASKNTLVLTSSPAFLKRLDPALEPTHCRHVFSAGGPLSNEAALLVENVCGCLPTEIYGTSESGIIAFRTQHQPDEAWTLFENIRFSSCADGNISLISPLLPQPEGMILSDKIQLLPAGQRQFVLLGRKDRIVKIAEQRISLTEIEQRLCALDLLSDASVLTLEKQGRLYIAAVLVLSHGGELLLQAQGQAALLGQIRLTLHQWLSPVSVPRYWRLASAIPLNQQGKRATAELQELFL
ncbi:AMP-binding protein [Rahnella aceris]|jgi:acyl-coenzyme A synthetase/AMP-(fatty) acid ligase|uniref:AMP-binding protein n=1 Tax=unclassified Rahnella TaxID=2635087 RepID=UPI000AC505F2|nr:MULTISPECIES: AMP-binding protein [unclassified Rahnella]